MMHHCNSVPCLISLTLYSLVFKILLCAQMQRSSSNICKFAKVQKRNNTSQLFFFLSRADLRANWHYQFSMG